MFNLYQEFDKLVSDMKETIRDRQEDGVYSEQETSVLLELIDNLLKRSELEPDDSDLFYDSPLRSWQTSSWCGDSL